jgi:uncharacterized protein (TIGR00159 family)
VKTLPFAHAGDSVMIETVRSFVETLVVNLRAADVIDVVLIASLVYAVFAWLRHRVSRVVGFGIMSVAVIYTLAQLLDLYLTAMVFQVGMTAIVVALVIVFQDDIRRLFERLRTMRLFEMGTRRAGQVDHDTLVEAADQLANRRIGALMVIPGRESLEVHLHGGVVADAKISVPLLMSIFDPDTDGHDGAVIVSDGRIERFAVHLPLSTQLAKVGPGGTRHAAALGLAERCDAFVVVVSEERGTISVAREGDIVALASAAELRQEIERFENADADEERGLAWPRWATHNFGLKFASLAMAALLWIMFAYRIEAVQRSYEVPIEYRGLESSWYLQDPKPTKAKVELSGSERAFDRVDPAQLKISVDMARVEEGPMQFSVTDDHLNEPTGIRMTDVEPRSLRLKAHKLVKMKLPIDVQMDGKVPDGYKLERVVTEPGRVEVLVPSFLVDYVKELTTEPIQVDQLRETKTVRKNLVLPQHIRPKGEQPPQIKIRLEVDRDPPPVATPRTGAGL